MQDKIKARIEQLTKERDAFLQQANAKIAAINGGIAELTLLLKDSADVGNPGSQTEDGE